MHNEKMLARLFTAYGRHVLLSLALLGSIYLTGSKIEWEGMPDIKPRVLSMFTEVPEGFVKVVEASDGDTIKVLIDGKEETVRLIGIDTPETKDPRRPVQCFGKEASAYTKSLIAGRAVKLVADTQQGDRDKYDRLLRYVYFEDGTTLNERLVYEGYAFAYESFPTERLEYLKTLEKDAREHSRGLWGGCQITIKNKGKSKSTNALKE